MLLHDICKHYSNYLIDKILLFSDCFITFVCTLDKQEESLNRAKEEDEKRKEVTSKFQVITFQIAETFCRRACCLEINNSFHMGHSKLCFLIAITISEA